MYRVLVLIAVGCGRIGFDTGGDGGAIGHDEDGDGVPDLVDDCPHIAGPQADRDGDGVGDACDPEPDNPRQHRALFAAMTPDDQPFQIGAAVQPNQLADALEATLDGGSNILDPDVTYGNVQITVGAVIVQVRGGAGKQHQLTISPNDGQGTYDFGELNEGVGYSSAQISHWDGNAYTPVMSQPLLAGVHTGAVQLQFTATVGGAVAFDGGWPGDVYHIRSPGPWRAQSELRLDINNLAVDFDYVFVVSW